ISAMSAASSSLIARSSADRCAERSNETRRSSTGEEDRDDHGNDDERPRLSIVRHPPPGNPARAQRDHNAACDVRQMVRPCGLRRPCIPRLRAGAPGGEGVERLNDCDGRLFALLRVGTEHINGLAARAMLKPRDAYDDKHGSHHHRYPEEKKVPFHVQAPSRCFTDCGATIAPLSCLVAAACPNGCSGL